MGLLPVIGAVAEVQNMPGFRSAIREVNSSLAGVGSTAKGVATGGATIGDLGLVALAATAAVATAAIVALATATVALSVHGVAVNATLERIGIQLDALTGAGQATLDWAKEMSTTTPFTPESVARALQMAYAYGFTGEQAKELVKTTADVSAAFGDQGDRMHRILIALGQMHGANKVNAQDMRQLTEAGIDAWRILADAAGVSVGEIRDRVKEGMVASDWAVAQFTAAMEERFGGAAERLSGSMMGVLANIQNILDIATAKVTFPMFDVIRDVLVGIKAELQGIEFQDLISDFRDLVSELSTGISPEGILSFFRDIIHGAHEAITFLRELRYALMDISPTQILANASNAVAANNAALATSLANLESSHADTLAAINSDAASAANTLARGLADIQEKYADKAESLSDRMAKAGRQFSAQMEKTTKDLNRRILDEQEGLQEKLTSLQESHDEKMSTIREDISDENLKYDEKIADLRGSLEEDIVAVQEKSADKRKDLEADLVAATTETQRAAIRAQIAALDAADAAAVEKLRAKEAKEEAKAKASHDRQLTMLTDRLNKEEVEYTKSVEKEQKRSDARLARLKEDYDVQVQELKTRLDEENAEISKQQGKMEADKAKEMADIQARYDQQVGLLQQRIDQENAAYAEQREQLIAETEAENTRIRESAEEMANALTTGPFAEIATKFRQLREDLVGGINWVVTTARPYIEEFQGWWAKSGILFKDLQSAWKNDLGPALNELWSVVRDELIPAIADLLGVEGVSGMDFLKGLLSLVAWGAHELAREMRLLNPVVREISREVDILAAGLRDIKRQVDLMQNMSIGIAIPWWLKPGSPTPFEEGLRGVAEATELVNSRLAALGQGAAAVSALAAQLSNPVFAPAPQPVPQTSPTVVVQGGSTTIDKRINVNASYAKTQDPSEIRHDLRLATLLQQR